ncbi:dTDP-4-dehydrorhamnose reductase [Aphanothece sacrum]|uniref:dTDP-4-dehydrorhamnose reductase n=1 Tax=Aphanothece sacrum FPU1 TaxID=1920663 RepID=A0A401IJJ8_APHSA|nr:dTDP-4-dehydrorhamnose reductase [Aphanothece sacrum]GBF81468.1 dTDP-4-dehydrorhamnose reductase [Aphanothece sacrum FPU1]GBF85599.1 dTDP-4-dehydrorhamnose reductase [Aphanothece sacrum FPU3]
MTKILLTGSNGQLGQELQYTLKPLGEVIGITRQMMDLSQPDQIRQTIQKNQPNIIVNSAAYTAVDKAESEPDLAFAINGIAPTIMAEEAQKIGAFLLQVSTDYVFDGTKNTPYFETDTTHPLSIYGQSKLAGEKGIEKHTNAYAILRTAWVYGTYGKSNFVKTMLKLGQEREQLRIVADQVGSPTYAQDIANAIANLLANSNVRNTSEIYHFTNSGVASWYDFAVAIFEEAQTLGFPIKVNQVVPITTSDYPTPAKRPAYSVLSGQKITSILRNYAPYWRNSLKQMLKQMLEQ